MTPANDIGQPGGGRRYPLVVVRRASQGRLTVEDVAGRSGVTSQLIRRFVALSVLDAQRDDAGQLWFDARAPATVARALRLHAGLGLNYASLGLVLDLLDRIDQLESALRRSGRPAKEFPPWT
jgi:hypothetical protein